MSESVRQFADLAAPGAGAGIGNLLRRQSGLADQRADEFGPEFAIRFDGDLGGAAKLGQFPGFGALKRYTSVVEDFKLGGGGSHYTYPYVMPGVIN